MLKRVLIIACVMLIVPSVTWGAQFTDTSSHWAEEIINKWADLGLINGYADGSFKPENGITRAEFVTLINQALGYKAEQKESFSDVLETDWHWKQVRRAMAVGYISGYEDKTFRPGNNVSRQEAAVILVRIMENNVKEASQFLYRYYDVKEIPQWSWLYLETAAREGYLLSYEDQTIRPAQPITRAETVYALEQIIGPAYVAEGRYGPDSDMEIVAGNAVISAGDITLRNTEIQGDLYITEGVGDGDVRLENVIVRGTTRIKGGGPNSVILEDSTLSEVIVMKKDGNLGVEIKGKTAIESMVLHSGVAIDGTRATGKTIGVLKIYYGEPDHEVHLTGHFKNVEVFAGDMDLILNEGEMADLIIQDDVKDATIKIDAFTLDDIVCSDTHGSNLQLVDSQVDELVLNHDQTIKIKDSNIQTLTLSEEVESPELTLTGSTVAAFNIYSPIELKTVDTDVTHLKLMDESGNVDLTFDGGMVDTLLISEKASLDFSRAGIASCTLKKSAAKTQLKLSTDSYIQELKVYGEATFYGRGDIIEASVYEDDVSFVETPRTLNASEDLNVNDGTTSYTGTLLWDNSLVENDRNNGSMEGVLRVTLYGDTFADTLRAYNEVTFSNVPQGLYGEVSRISDTVVEIRFEGLASSHASTNDVSNVKVTFSSAAFSTLQSSQVKNASRSNIVLHYHD